jgi:hypothetical protein
MTVARQRHLRLIAVGGLCFACAHAGAQESALGARVGMRLTSSDNVALAPDGFEQSERIADIQAGVNFARTTARLTTDLDYEIQGVFYDEFDGSDEVFHRLDASTQVEVVAERFFVDFFGVYDQTVVDPAGQFFANNLTLTGNRTDVAILGVSPSVALNFGANVTGEIRQSHTKLNYDDPQLQDTTEGFLRFALANSNARSGGTWGVQYGKERFEYDLTTEVDLETFELELGYWVTPTARIFTTQGLESDYEQFGLTGSGGLDEHFWYVGTDWRPDDRTTVALSVGQRNSDTSHRFEWNRRLSFGGLSVSYSEQPSTFLRERLNNVRRVGELDPIDSIDGPLGNLLYLQERLSAAFYVDRPKSSLGFRVFSERRFEILDSAPNADGETDRVRGTEISARWQMDTRTTLSGSMQVARRRSLTNGFDDELTNFTVQMTKLLGRQTELSFILTRQRDVPEAITPTELELEETELSVGIQRRFGTGGAGGGDVTQRFSGYVDSGQTR